MEKLQLYIEIYIYIIFKYDMINIKNTKSKFEW